MIEQQAQGRADDAWPNYRKFSAGPTRTDMVKRSVFAALVMAGLAVALTGGEGKPATEVAAMPAIALPRVEITAKRQRAPSETQNASIAIHADD